MDLSLRKLRPSLFTSRWAVVTKPPAIWPKEPLAEPLLRGSEQGESRSMVVGSGLAVIAVSSSMVVSSASRSVVVSSSSSGVSSEQ